MNQFPYLNVVRERRLLRVQTWAVKNTEVFTLKRWEWVGTESLSFLGINQLYTGFVQ